MMEMAQGNPNPSPETRFVTGSRPNPQGKTSAQRAMEIENAERATRIRSRMLADLEREIERMADEAAKEEKPDTVAVGAIKADILRLLKDSEDRGFGAPTVLGPGPNGEHTINGAEAMAAATLAALARKHDAEPES